VKKKIFSICLSVVVLVSLIVVLVPGCTGDGEQGTIEVKATLCDEAWEGDVDYTLTPASGSAVTGTNVTASFNVTAGEWTCEDVSGGPAGAYLESITPDPTQTLAADGTITFTLEFEEKQDAWIEFLTWTINGVPIEEWEGHWDYEPGLGYYAEVTWCDVIDVHYQQGVDGCQGREVTLNETDEIKIHYAWGEGDPPPEVVWVEVLNDDCAVVKEPHLEGPTPEKLGQVPSFEGKPIGPKDEKFYPLPWCNNVTLDVETSWELVKCLNYTKTINWLHIGECIEPPCEWCVLFNLLVPGPGFGFQLWPHACVELVDDVDVKPDNNCADGPPLYLQIV